MALARRTPLNAPLRPEPRAEPTVRVVCASPPWPPDRRPADEPDRTTYLRPN